MTQATLHFMLRIAVLLVVCATVAFAQANEYDPIYRDTQSTIFSRRPNAFLVEMVRTRTPGKALDIGMGQGRNSVFLAQQGWDMTGIDLSAEGIRQAHAGAARAGVKITTIQSDFMTYDFGENRWDLIVLTYEPVKQLATKVERALKSGGAVLIEDRHTDTRRVWPAGTFGNNERLSLFPSLRVLRYEDLWARSEWNVKQLDERLVRLFAEKPVPAQSGCVWEAKPVAAGESVCWETVRFECGAAGWRFTGSKCAQ